MPSSLYDNRSSASFLKAPPKIDKSKPQSKSNPLDPSFLRDVFEGLMDSTMGAVGVGPDTTANRFGSLVSAALPFKGLLGGAGKLSNVNSMRNTSKVLPEELSAVIEAPKKLGRFGDIALKGSDFPPQNRLAMGMNPSGGTYDNVGRYIGPSPKVDPVFDAHVASSVGKFKPGIKIQSPEEAFVSKGDTSGASPSSAMIDELLKRFSVQRARR